MLRALFKTHGPRGGEGVSCWGKGNDHRFRGLQTVLPTFFIRQWRLSDTCPPPSDNGLLLTGCPPFPLPLASSTPCQLQWKAPAGSATSGCLWRVHAVLTHLSLLKKGKKPGKLGVPLRRRNGSLQAPTRKTLSCSKKKKKPPLSIFSLHLLSH